MPNHNNKSTISPFDNFSPIEHVEYCKWLENANSKIPDPSPNNVACTTYNQTSTTNEIKNKPVKIFKAKNYNLNPTAKINN